MSNETPHTMPSPPWTGRQSGAYTVCWKMGQAPMRIVFISPHGACKKAEHNISTWRHKWPVSWGRWEWMTKNKLSRLSSTQQKLFIYLFLNTGITKLKAKNVPSCKIQCDYYAREAPRPHKQFSSFPMTTEGTRQSPPVHSSLRYPGWSVSSLSPCRAHSWHLMRAKQQTPALFNQTAHHSHNLQEPPSRSSRRFLLNRLYERGMMKPFPLAFSVHSKKRNNTTNQPEKPEFALGFALRFSMNTSLSDFKGSLLLFLDVQEPCRKSRQGAVTHAHTATLQSVFSEVNIYFSSPKWQKASSSVARNRQLCQEQPSLM